MGRAICHGHGQRARHRRGSCKDERATIFLRDVAHMRDGFSPQTNIVKQNGQRGLMRSVGKNGGAATLNVVGHLQEKPPGRLPRDIHARLLADQSIFVKTAAPGGIHEALVAALGGG